MAILESLGGFSVSIRTPNGTQKEYIDKDAEDSPRTVTKYIEAVSGANFFIAWDFLPSFPYRYYSISAHVYLDGKYVDGAVFRPKQPWDPLGDHYTLAAARSMKNGRWIEQKFAFSDITVDDENQDVGKKCLKESIETIGEISIRLWRVVETGLATFISRELSLNPLEKVPEKALKGRALSHQVSLGEAVTIAPVLPVATANIDPENEPFATFNFRYRSAEALKALCIIPRTPEPIPLEDRPIEDLTTEEMRELLRRQKEQNAAARTADQKVKDGAKQKRKVKREHDNLDEDDDEVTIKQERPTNRQRTSADLIEEIDLTGDD